jgi:hypothetical protein
MNEIVMDPRDAVLRLVCAPGGERRQLGVRRRGLLRRARWAASTQAGPGFGARPTTLRFLKARDLGDRRLFVVDFTGDDGGTWEWTVMAERKDGGWHATGICGGTTVKGRPGTAQRRTEPWANLGGQWGPTHHVISGLIEGPSPLLVDRVRLRVGDEVRDEDLVEDRRVLLFATAPGDQAARVEMLDGSGAVIRTQEWPNPGTGAASTRTRRSQTDADRRRS